MFRYFFYVVVLTASCNTATQKDVQDGIDTSILTVQPQPATISPSVNKMKKYSLRVVSVNSEGQELVTGTGFFMKHKRKLFFITNKHVAYPNVPTYLRGSSYLNVFLDSVTYRISLNKYPRDTFIETENIDIAAFHLNEPPVVYNDVTDFLDIKYFNKSPDRYIVWGFPFNESKPSFEGEKLFQGNYVSSDSLAKKIAETSNPNVKFNDISFQDIPGSFLLPFELVHGLSGSPIFGIFKEGNDEHIKFLGIVKQGSHENKIGRGVYGDSVIYYLNKKNH